MCDSAENNNNVLDFNGPQDQFVANIKVIGVGGGGGNAVNNMYKRGIKGVDFIVCNTDLKALNASDVPNKIVLGYYGAGNDPNVAREAAVKHSDEIRNALGEKTQMLFITAGMGGGTGTGAAPVVAEVAKSIERDDEVMKNILVVAVVTMPFSFEGPRRNNQALEGVKELSKFVDSILVINDDKLRESPNLKLGEAFGLADNVLFDAVKGIAEIITCSSYVTVDIRDVNSVMKNSGTALMGTGIGAGDNRAQEAIEAATSSKLLNDNDIRGAQNALLYFSYSSEYEVNMEEIAVASDYVTNLIGGQGANIIWGTGIDEDLGDKLKITIIATGYNSNGGNNGGSNEDTPKGPRRIDGPSVNPTQHPNDTRDIDILYRDIIGGRPIYTDRTEVKPQAKVQTNEAPKAEEPFKVVSRPQNSGTIEAAIAEARNQSPIGRTSVEQTETIRRRNVISLYDEPVSSANTRPQVRTMEDLYADPRMEVVTAPAAAPAAAPAQAVETVRQVAYTVKDKPISAFQPQGLPIESREPLNANHNYTPSDKLEDIIRKMRKDPSLLETINMAEYTGEAIHQGTPSNESEISRMSFDTEGLQYMVSPHLYSQPD